MTCKTVLKMLLLHRLVASVAKGILLGSVPGLNVKILRIFSPKNLAKIMAVFHSQYSYIIMQKKYA
jgi:hypothetical protein